MSKILENVHKSASRLHEAGVVDDVTMREFDALCLPPLRDYSPEDIKKIGNENRVSQAVFAKYLNVKKIIVAAWGQGTKKPAELPSEFWTSSSGRALRPCNSAPVDLARRIADHPSSIARKIHAPWHLVGIEDHAIAAGALGGVECPVGARYGRLDRFVLADPERTADADRDRNADAVA